MSNPTNNRYSYVHKIAPPSTYNKNLSTDEVYKVADLFQRTFRAQNKAISKIDPSSTTKSISTQRPLCLRSMVQMLNHTFDYEHNIEWRKPGLAKDVLPDLPNSCNAAVDWIFSQLISHEAIERARNDLATCKCDLDDEFIRSMHSSKLDERVLKPSSEYFRRKFRFVVENSDDPDDVLMASLLGSLFCMLHLLLKSITFARLAKLQDRPEKSYKEKDKCYASLVRIFNSTPAAVLQAVCCVFEKYRCSSALEFVSTVEIPAHALSAKLMYSCHPALAPLLAVTLHRVRAYIRAIIKHKTTMDEHRFGPEMDPAEEPGSLSPHDVLALSNFMDAAISIIPIPSTLPTSLLQITKQALDSIAADWTEARNSLSFLDENGALPISQ